MDSISYREVAKLVTEVFPTFFTFFNAFHWVSNGLYGRERYSIGEDWDSRPQLPRQEKTGVQVPSSCNRRRLGFESPARDRRRLVFESPAPAIGEDWGSSPQLPL